jgi:hypothetical protein
MPAIEPYSLEAAELDIAALIGKVDRLSEVLTKLDSTDPPNNPAAGLIHYSMAGQHKYASSDGNDYNTGRSTQITSGTTLINSLSEITIAGLSFPVLASTDYLIWGTVRGTNGSTVAQQAVGLDVTGGVASSVNVDVVLFNTTGNVYEGTGEITALGGRVGTTSNLNAADKFIAQYQGLIRLSTGGTLVITGSCVTAAADTWTAQARSRMTVMPVT